MNELNSFSNENIFEIGNISKRVLINNYEYSLESVTICRDGKKSYCMFKYDIVTGGYCYFNEEVLSTYFNGTLSFRTKYNFSTKVLLDNCIYRIEEIKYDSGNILYIVNHQKFKEENLEGIIVLREEV